MSAATDDDDHNNEDTAAITSNDSANNVITSIIVDNRDDKERHCVSLPLYYDQVSTYPYHMHSIAHHISINTVAVVIKTLTIFPKRRKNHLFITVYFIDFLSILHISDYNSVCLTLKVVVYRRFCFSCFPYTHAYLHCKQQNEILLLN